MEAVMSDRVRSYFDGAADRFDSIYRPDKSLGQKLIDRLFHRVMHRRFDLTLELCGADLRGQKVLDIGCGSGLRGRRGRALPLRAGRFSRLE